MADLKTGAGVGAGTGATALIADDEPLLREALEQQLASAWPQLQVVAQARNGREAVAQFEALQPDICFDLYLNAHACWRNVPARVWAYTLGGYPVLKKWLSYREEPLLKRPLKPEEAQYFSEVARRIAALLLLAPELDANYRAVTAATYAWRG
ncbi:MAG: transcriptional regulator NarL [bacterium ADurb.Bin429]|nr:MAG: transcriptional regulator NarL [bacterium ADurb.Bin429]